MDITDAMLLLTSLCALGTMKILERMISSRQTLLSASAPHAVVRTSRGVYFPFSR